MDTIPDAVDALPRAGRDEPVHVTVYDYGREPGMWVRVAGRWVYGVVRARHDYKSGRGIEYHIEHQRADGTQTAGGFYKWPQPGLRPYREPKDRR